jgi:D-alanine transaminase
MSRIAYVNGRYLPHAAASVAIDDRGYQFADGVYEVVPVHAGGIIDLKAHLDRLRYSLDALRIGMPAPPRAIELICNETLVRNRVADGTVYLQVTRGVAPRDHGFPKASLKPALVVTATAVTWPLDAAHDLGAAIITTPELRWGRCDIKTTALLPNVLAKQKAREAGAFEAWFVRPDGTITEGASTNAWIVDRDGRILTRPLGPEILAGITRATVLRLARAAGFEVIERPFSQAELVSAREAFLTSTTSLVRAVVSVDGKPIANGHPGEIARRLRGLCIGHYRGTEP